MNQFGGNWTKIKIEMLVEYAQAYLTIMNKYKFFKTLYFDGFAGSGFIVKDDKIDIDVTIGAARRIVEISKPKSFDLYYFVEKDVENFKQLEANTKLAFPDKADNIHVVCEDCNKKLIDLANFLRRRENRSYRTLVYIDPCGMQVEWRSLECLKSLNVDMWILVPTGMGVVRLLKNDGMISDGWYERLERFLGMSREDIYKEFYSSKSTLFPDVQIIEREKDVVNKSAKLYQRRLNELFSHVSSPYELRNSANSTMYHFFLASNNAKAVKIGNDIINKYNKQHGTIIHRMD